MRVISARTVRQFAADQPTARGGLNHWLAVAEKAEWTCLDDVRKSFRSADQVTVASGRTVVVFNIKKNDYRLIAAIHYNKGIVFTMRFMTHAEYSKDLWKGQL